MAFRLLQNKEAATILFREIAPKVAERPGGYTRIIRLGNRLGDNAEMCMMELVDFNENLLGKKTTKKSKTTRRGPAKKAAPAKAETVAEQPETPAADVTEENKD